MNVLHQETTAENVIVSARALAPRIAERADLIEADRRVPRDLLDELIAQGSLRMLLPRSHGGVGADLPAALRLFETLAAADASVAWTVMIGGSGWLDLTGLPRATFDALFTPGRDVVVAGAFAPTGSIIAAADGYRVTGRWGFVSGCEHATWLYGNCVEETGDLPRLRIAVFTPDQVRIEDTWTVSGLCGTASHHVAVVDAVVPAEWTLGPMVDQPCVDTPVARIPVPALLALAIACVAVGIAQGAVDDIVALAIHKVPLLAGAPLAADHLFRADLARMDTELRAARAVLHECAAALWATAIDAAPVTLRMRAEARATAVWVTERAAAVVGAAYRSGGGTAIYRTSPLQRRLRDVDAVTQHFLVRRDTMATAGAVFAGHDIDVALF